MLFRNTFEGLDLHAQESSNLSLHGRTFVTGNTPCLVPDPILKALHHGATLIQYILLITSFSLPLGFMKQLQFVFLSIFLSLVDFKHEGM